MLPLVMTWRFLPFLTLALLCVADAPAGSRAAEPPTGAAILQQLRAFKEMGSVLYVAAHPDDENTLLIAYLARGRDYRTAYLSLTRGDGGQNVLGPEFGAKLGVARTQELLAARRLDGGRQFFTRAIDFGYSKDYRETLRIWDKQAVLSDIVRVYRTFRPDVVVTGFSPQPSGTHGHHTASAVLALEAFKLSGDPKAFPEQLVPAAGERRSHQAPLRVWQPKRILVNRRFFRSEPPPGGLRLEISGQDPVLGISFAELAARSRAMHKTQGFANFTMRGGNGPHTELFELLAGEPATNDIMDGIDTTWARVPGGAPIGKGAEEVIAGFQPTDPAASVPALLKLRSRLAALESKDPLVVEKRALLDRILQACLGLKVQTVLPNAEIVPGEALEMRHTASVGCSVPVRWVEVRYPSIKAKVSAGQQLQMGQPSTLEAAQTLPAGTPLTMPYWLRKEGTPGTFRVDDPSLIGRPENPPVFPIEQVFQVEGQTLVVPDQPVQLTTNTAHAQVRQRLDVIPPAYLSFDAEVSLFAPGSTHAVQVEVSANRPNLSGRLALRCPGGWQVAPALAPFNLHRAGDHLRLKFDVTAPATPGTAMLLATAEVGGVLCSNQRVVIQYSHIPRQLLQPPAELKAISLHLATRGHRIGYLPGAGDSVAESLRQMGYTVTNLTEADLTPEGLHGLDAVVIGVRAFNVRPNLAKHLPGLFAYVQAGGTVVAQYNRPENGRSLQVAPYELELSSERVTDETAPVTFLAPENPVLQTPNQITQDDFKGWVQERGIYFPSHWDEHFTPILASGDPGETPLRGGLLVARYGRGYYVYTGLVFFRQLPAGVPGAFRLFANLVSLGK